MQTRTKPLLRALAGETVNPPPIWLMRQAGRYLPEYRKVRSAAGSFLDLCYTPALAAEVTLQPIRRFSFDAAIIFSDILLVPHALGQSVSFREGIGPVLDPIAAASDLPASGSSALPGRLTAVMEAISLVGSTLPKSVALIGFAGAPWTVATYMVEGGTSRAFERVKAFALGRPSEFQHLIDILVEATADYLIRQISAGAEAIQLFDSWAGVLPETAFERWCVAPVVEIVDRVKEAHPGTPVIGFPRGIGPRYETYASSTGVDAVSIDYALPRGWAHQHLETASCIQGNLDPVYLLVGDAVLDEEAANVVKAFAARPFVFNLGHGVLPTTPVENVDRLVRVVRAHG